MMRRESTFLDPCEWNPDKNRPVHIGEEHAPAKILVGYDGCWRLCIACSNLPYFEKYGEDRKLIDIQPHRKTLFVGGIADGERRLIPPLPSYNIPVIPPSSGLIEEQRLDAAYQLQRYARMDFRGHRRVFSIMVFEELTQDDVFSLLISRYPNLQEERD